MSTVFRCYEKKIFWGSLTAFNFQGVPGGKSYLEFSRPQNPPKRVQGTTEGFVEKRRGRIRAESRNLFPADRSIEGKGSDSSAVEGT